MADHPSGPAVPGLVSIGLPTANRARYLTESLRAILSQTYPAFELIISDNASTDDTESICRRTAEQDPRVRYHRNATNIGIIGNCNRVMDLARGEYFVLATDDDLWEPEFLQTLAPILAHNPDVSLAFTGWDWIDAQGKHLRPGAMRRFDETETRFAQLVHLLHGGYAHLIFGLQRLASLRRTPGFLPFNADGHGADVVVLFEQTLQGRVVTVPARLFHYRLASNISRLSADSDYAEVVLKELRYYVTLLARVRQAPLPASQIAALRAVLIRRFCRSVLTYNLLFASRDRSGRPIAEEARELLRRHRCHLEALAFFPPGVQTLLEAPVVRRGIRVLDQLFAH